MNAIAPVAQQQRLSILQTVANRYSMEPSAFEATVRATVVPQNCSKEQFAACMVVANEHKLNPLLKEIYFFPARGGGIVPMVGVDGWCRIINEHPAFDGMEFDTAFVENKPFSVTCRMFRKDRARPIVVTEFLSECYRPSDPWKTAPARMLRHKAMIQAARYAFGFSGIYDEDDAERIKAESARDITPSRGVIQATQQQVLPPSRRVAPEPPADDPPPTKTGSAAPEPPEEVNWPAELEAYDNRVSACETDDALAECVESYGGVFDDAPADVKSEARKLEAACRDSLARSS